MKGEKQFNDASEFSGHLGRLHDERSGNKIKSGRRSLSWKEKELVFAKTCGRCHICGGAIAQDDAWDADHVFAHVQGGVHSVDNYLPAHSTCNKYRWFYGPEEFQWILKLGVWLRTRIEEKNRLAIELADAFVKYEHKRNARRKK